MQVIKDLKQMQLAVDKRRQNGEHVGFVPTMGALHEGHVSLIKKARDDNRCVVVCIFLNPIQFDRKEDLIAYPIQLEQDHKIAEKSGVDIVFEPDAAEMYPDGFDTFVDVCNITDLLCGAERPGHFRGVATVVTKLFNIVKPDKAYFGQKDFQQTVVIKRLVKDLCLGVEIVVLPVVREPDGLAFSSRNRHLSLKERTDALLIFKGIKEARLMVGSGAKNSDEVIKCVEGIIKSGECVKEIDYIAIVDEQTLGNMSVVNSNSVLVIAVWVGKTRLIDNGQLYV